MSKLIHKQAIDIPLENQQFQLVTVAIYCVLGIAYAGLIDEILLVFVTISSIIYNLFNYNKTKTKTNCSIHLLTTLVLITESLHYMVPMLTIMIDVIQNGCLSTPNSNSYHNKKMYNNNGIISENTSNSSDNTIANNDNNTNNNNNNNNENNNISCFYLLYYISIIIMLFIPIRLLMFGLFIYVKNFNFIFENCTFSNAILSFSACFMIVFYIKWYNENNNNSNNNNNNNNSDDDNNNHYNNNNNDYYHDDFDDDDSNWEIFECMICLVGVCYNYY